MSSLGLMLKTTFINSNAPLNNGVGRFIPQLARITLKFCKSHGSSQGARRFIEEDIVHFAKKNPGIVVYLKPRRHRSPTLVAEFLNGETFHQSLNNYSVEEIAANFDILKNHSGRAYSDQFKNKYSDHPSVQGYWTPYVNRDPVEATTKYPQDKRPLITEESATELAQRMFASQQSDANLPRAEEEKLETRKQGEV